MKNATDATLTKIARDILLIDTLEAQNRDALDFHDLSVWQINAALQAAFDAGKAAK
jgi:hypothetical protein